MRSRREFLKTCAIAGAGAALLPDFLLRAASAPGAASGKPFVFIFLRGAADGLNICVPYGANEYAALRRSIAVPPPGKGERAALPLGDGHFGLHPALAPLMPLWRDKTLALVPGAGLPDPTRSHFDAQDYLGLGTPGRRETADGFLARALAAGSRGAPAPLAAVAFGPQLPACLRGFPAAIAGTTLDTLVDRAPGAAIAQKTLQRMYGGASAGASKNPEGGAARGEYAFGDGADELLEASARAGGAAVKQIDKILATVPAGAGYPRGPAATALRQLAQLLKADAGVRVASLDIGGWDHHSAENARLNAGLAELGGALRAFRDDLGDKFNDLAIVVATEFGRTARENGSGGTDHGHGSLALLLGGRVNGGRVHGRWPGLHPGDLYEGRDLAVTTDLRDLLAGGLKRQLGAPPANLFPNYSPRDAGAIFG